MRSLLILALGLSIVPAASQARDAQTIVAEIKPRQEAYKSCLSSKAVTLGKDNSESAETILRAVAALCRDRENDLWALYSEMPLPRGRASWLMAEHKREGEDAGIASLLIARASK